MGRARFDVNNIHTLTGVSSSDGSTPVELWADPSTHALVVGASVTLSKDNIPATSLTQAVAVQIVDGSGNQISSFGGGTQYTDAGVPPAHPTAPTLLFNNAGAWATVGSATPLPVTGSLTVGGTTDNSAFTAGTTTGTPAMGFYHSTIDTVTDGRAAAVGITNKRAMLVTLQTSGGADTGVAASPLQVSLANTGANSNKLLVTADAITFASPQHVIADSGTISTITNVVHIDDNSGSLTVDNGGTFAVQATLAAETTKVIGVTRTADGSGNLITSTSNALDINIKSGNLTTLPVTNAGTFAVQATVAAGATNIAKAEDVASADADVGVPSMAIRKASPANTSGTDGDYEMLQVSAGRLWASATIDSALPAGTNVIGHVISDTGSTTAVTGTVTISGTVTANAGTNLNTSLLALESGNLATLAGTAVTIDGTSAPAKALVVSGESNDGTPQYNPLPLGAGGRSVIVEGFAGSTNVPVVLNAETTKVIGVTRTSDGAGNLLTSNSTTYTAKFGLDANLLGTLGTAFSTAGKVDVKGADGDVFVRQTTGSNLHTVLDSGTLTTLTTLTGITNTVVTDDLAAAATGSAVPANAHYQGLNAQTALPTAASAGNLTGATGDKFGRAVVLNNAVRDIMGTQTTTITASTSETTIITQIASTFNDLVSLFISNTSATAARVDIRDTTAGSVIFPLYIPAGDMRGLSLPTPWPQTSVNTNWTAQSSTSVTDLRISALYIKNK